MIKDGLYHKDIFFPFSPANDISYPVQLTCHAIEAAYNDRYEPITDIPTTINLSKESIIEILVERGEPVKIVIRRPYNQEYDLSMVIRLTAIPLPVVTVWLNEVDDLHQTMDTSKYVRK